MEAETTNARDPILEKAWLRHAELDANASRLSKRHLNLRKWVAILGVLATFLAIVSDIISTAIGDTQPLLVLILKIMLIATPLLGSMVAAFTSRELGDGRWLSMRAGAEEMVKDIYIYRTVLTNNPDRSKWLSHRLANTSRQVYKSSGNKLDTVPYQGNIPVVYSGDPGFTNLTPEEYIRYRLQDQLSWHEKKIVTIGEEKRKLTITILGMGALGALLAGIGGPFAVWVALTASFTAALVGWEELRNREKTIANYSKVKLELTIIRDYWYALSPAEQNDSAFYRMVLATEKLMFAQNSQYIRSMQDALSGADDEDKKLVEDMVQMSATSNAELQKKLLSESQAVFAEATQQLSAVAEDAAATVSGMVTAVSAEAIALNQTMEDVVISTVAESAAIRQTITETVDATTAEVAASRTAVEASRDATLAEVAAGRAALEATRDETLDEVAAWRDTAQESVNTAVAQSAAIQEMVTAETDAWEETSQEMLAGVSATSAAGQATATQEAAAWQQSAQDALDTAVGESAALRDTANTAVEMTAATADAWQESAQDTLDTAVEQFAPPTIGTDEMVDQAVDRVLQEGVVVADEAIKMALAQATEDELS